MRYENGVGKWGRVGERDRKREIKMEKQLSAPRKVCREVFFALLFILLTFGIYSYPLL